MSLIKMLENLLAKTSMKIMMIIMRSLAANDASDEGYSYDKGLAARRISRAEAVMTLTRPKQIREQSQDRPLNISKGFRLGGFSGGGVVTPFEESGTVAPWQRRRSSALLVA